MGTVSGKYTAGGSADTRLQVGQDGVDAGASGTIGLAAQLEAAAELQAGDENVSGSAELNAKVEALLGAEGKVDLHIDKNGITIGGEARAGAYVSAEAKLGFGLNFFGLQTNATVTVEGHAGALAEGEALVTIGFDGKIRFRVGAGLAVGLGASADVEFEVDASQLIERLGLADLTALVVWIEEFRKDPKAFIGQIIDEALKAAVQQGVDLALEGLKQLGAYIGLFDSSVDQIADSPSPSQAQGAGCSQPPACDVAERYLAYAQKVYTNDSAALNSKTGCGPGHEVESAKSIGGMYAQVSKDPVTGEYVLAFRGSTSDPRDWLANLNQGLSGDSSYHQNAAKYAKQVQDVLSYCYPGAKVTIVGHSLGGSLAQRAAYATGYPTITFNPSALGNFAGRDDAKFASLCINNYVDAYDILHTLVNPPTDGVGWIADALGGLPGVNLPQGTHSVGIDHVRGQNDPAILAIYSEAAAKAQQDLSKFIVGPALATLDLSQGVMQAGVAAHLLTDEQGNPGPLARALQSDCSKARTQATSGSSSSGGTTGGNAQSGGSNDTGTGDDDLPPNTPPTGPITQPGGGGTAQPPVVKPDETKGYKRDANYKKLSK